MLVLVRADTNLAMDLLAGGWDNHENVISNNKNNNNMTEKFDNILPLERWYKNRNPPPVCLGGGMGQKLEIAKRTPARSIYHLTEEKARFASRRRLACV